MALLRSPLFQRSSTPTDPGMCRASFHQRDRITCPSLPAFSVCLSQVRSRRTRPQRYDHLEWSPVAHDVQTCFIDFCDAFPRSFGCAFSAQSSQCLRRASWIASSDARPCFNTRTISLTPGCPRLAWSFLIAFFTRSRSCLE